MAIRMAAAVGSTPESVTPSAFNSLSSSNPASDSMTEAATFLSLPSIASSACSGVITASGLVSSSLCAKNLANGNLIDLSPNSLKPDISWLSPACTVAYALIASFMRTTVSKCGAIAARAGVSSIASLASSDIDSVLRDHSSRNSVNSSCLPDAHSSVSCTESRGFRVEGMRLRNTKACAPRPGPPAAFWYSVSLLINCVRAMRSLSNANKAPLGSKPRVPASYHIGSVGPNALVTMAISSLVKLLGSFKYLASSLRSAIISSNSIRWLRVASGTL